MDQGNIRYMILQHMANFVCTLHKPKIKNQFLLPLNDPVIAPMDRTMKNSDIDEMVVCSKSLKSSNVGPITAPHNPYMFII